MGIQKREWIEFTPLHRVKRMKYVGKYEELIPGKGYDTLKSHCDEQPYGILKEMVGIKYWRQTYTRR